MCVKDAHVGKKSLCLYDNLWVGYVRMRQYLNTEICFVQTKEGEFILSAMTSGIRRNWIQTIMKHVRPNTAPDVTRYVTQVMSPHHCRIVLRTPFLALSRRSIGL